MEIDKARWLVSQSGQQKVLSMIGWLSEKLKIDVTNGNNGSRMGFWFGIMNLGMEIARKLRLKAASAAKSTEMASV
ncbi:hypothetical protein BCON_0001g00810 [Botryotinia convoluta]|uniref:Uncharacterized protein n=1 Tax=Botryotinia convoluta TaxID=54673 RepID=A0A4Z1IWP8_9HELO|nr:hypothetical protein BCON_0001g00810 [Botryotinia convoluta]